jgi:hypothetical protein
MHYVRKKKKRTFLRTSQEKYLYGYYFERNEINRRGFRFFLDEKKKKSIQLT